ncbi:hypothetical protein SPONL_2036 [uncultured Candidatus Thioglobus sp.]|nr:hypothetical protein SPONL_2036 [uncultured Candidatus Thioglobus sp.]
MQAIVGQVLGDQINFKVGTCTSPPERMMSGDETTLLTILHC